MDRFSLRTLKMSVFRGRSFLCLLLSNCRRPHQNLLGSLLSFVVVIRQIFSLSSPLTPLSSTTWLERVSRRRYCRRQRRHRCIYFSPISRSAEDVTGCIVCSIPDVQTDSIRFDIFAIQTSRFWLDVVVKVRWDRKISSIFVRYMLILNENGYLNKLNIVDSTSGFSL